MRNKDIMKILVFILIMIIIIQIIVINELIKIYRSTIKYSKLLEEVITFYKIKSEVREKV